MKEKFNCQIVTKMIFRAIFSLLLAVTICLPARADLDKLIELKQGKEGYQERCYAKYVLRNAIIRYSGEPVVDGLEADLEKLETILEKEKRGNYWDCSVYSGCNNLRQFSLPNESKPDKYLSKFCNRYVKFGYLRDFFQDVTPDIGTKSWVTEIRKIHSGKFKEMRRICPKEIVAASKAEAETEFEIMKSYNAKDLAKAKQALVDKLEADRIEITKIAEEAYRSIRDTFATNLPKFKQCWERVEQLDDERAAKVAREADEFARKSLEEKKKARKKNRFFSALFRD